jgi:hypothetical protein
MVVAVRQVALGSSNLRVGQGFVRTRQGPRTTGHV